MRVLCLLLASCTVISARRVGRYPIPQPHDNSTISTNSSINALAGKHLRILPLGGESTTQHDSARLISTSIDNVRLTFHKWQWLSIGS